MATLWSWTSASLGEKFYRGFGPQVAIGAAACVALLSPVEWPQLALVLVGVALAARMQDARPRKIVNPLPLRPAKLGALPRTCSRACSTCSMPRFGRVSASPQAADLSPAHGKTSNHPVLVRRFAAEDFAGQVQELMAQLRPSPQCHRLAQDLAESVRQQLQKMLPEVNVLSVVTGSISRGTAFCVAVPEVEIVVEMRQDKLVAGLRRHMRKNAVPPGRLDTHKLQKLAVRVCTDYLVASDGFRFRRSAFRAAEPKVTLMAPAAACFSARPVAFDFSVNSEMCLCNASLIEECASLEPRARDLIILVRCWAKDRGICHAPKGHLPPYAWTLMVIFYLQAGVEEPMLPPFQGFKTMSGLVVRQGHADGNGPSPKGQSRTRGASVAELFAGFVRFYVQIDWRQEAVSVRRARRAAPHLALPLHTIISESNSIEATPTIEDPFSPRRSLGACVTAEGLARLGQELARAKDIICSPPASLSELLAPWTPPAPPGCGAAVGDNTNAKSLGAERSQTSQHKRAHHPCEAPCQRSQSSSIESGSALHLVGGQRQNTFEDTAS